MTTATIASRARDLSGRGRDFEGRMAGVMKMEGDEKGNFHPRPDLERRFFCNITECARV